VEDAWSDLNSLEYSVIRKLESKLSNLQKLAIEKGCCLENYDLFIIRHIFSAKYHMVVKSLKMVYTIASSDN
jgi:hypothetical protein